MTRVHTRIPPLRDKKHSIIARILLGFHLGTAQGDFPFAMSLQLLQAPHQLLFVALAIDLFVRRFLPLLLQHDGLDGSLNEEGGELSRAGTCTGRF